MQDAADVDLRDTRHAPGGTNGHGGHDGERSMGVLVTDAASQISTLAHKEMELAQRELREDVIAAAAGTAGFGIAGALALLAGIFLSAAAVFGIAEALPLWAAALIVGGVELVGAGMFALIGRRAVKHVSAPERTVRTMKENIECLRHPTS